MSDAKTTSIWRLPAALALGVLCLGLAYAAISESLAAHWRRDSPDQALMLRPGDGPASVAQAERLASEALTQQEIDQASAAAQRALRRAPIDPTPLRILAETRQLNGDDRGAGLMMDLAGKRSLRDPKVQLWLMRESLAAKRYDDAFARADLLVRRHGELSPTIYPLLTASLDEQAARNALVALMRGGPSWRADFLRVQAEGQGVAVAPWLMENLASSPNPPTEQEIGVVASRLAYKGEWTRVRALWSRFGDRSKGLLYNGDFDQPPTSPPFGWRLVDDNGTVSAIERVDGSANRALFAEFPVGRNSPLAERLLVLAPGRYRLSGKIKVDRLPSTAYFRLAVSCSSGAEPLATIDQTAVTGWKTFEADFDVPTEDCDAQWLRLGGSGGEGYDPASAWFDDLRLDLARTAGPVRTASRATE